MSFKFPRERIHRKKVIKAILRDSDSILIIKLVFSFLTPTERNHLFKILVSQVLASAMELIALSATGVVVSLVIRVEEGSAPGDRVGALLSIFNLNNLPILELVLVFSIIAFLLFTIRTLISVWFVRQSLQFSGSISARLSTQLASHYMFDLSNERRLKLNQQELSYAVTGGTVRLISGTFGNLNMLIADGFLLGIVLVGLFIVDPVSTLFMSIYFLSFVILLHSVTSLRLRRNSMESSGFAIDSSHYFLETILLFREFKLRNALTERLQRFTTYRKSFAKTQVYLQFLPNVSKYIVEIALIFGITFISLIQVLNSDLSRSLPTLALFVIAASRLAPGLFRLQQNYSSFIAAFEASKQTQQVIKDYAKLSVKIERKDLLDNIESVPYVEEDSLVVSSNHRNNTGVSLYVRDLSFSFLDVAIEEKGQNDALLRNVNLSILPNTISALMGKSGSGKSTLADLIISAREGYTGQILIDGSVNKSFIAKNPGKVAFVPQSPVLLQGSFGLNIAMKDTLTVQDRRLVEELLGKVGLDDLLFSLKEGLDSQFSFGGRHLSGGQLQRVSLARALFTKPRLLIVDEYTSALDEVTERVVTEVVKEISSSCTVLIISHRPKTIFDCENYFVIKEGSIHRFESLEEALQFQSHA